jgi:predicted HTH transcriptional regulator
MTAVFDDINNILLKRHLLNDKYPIPECNQLEFKKTFHVNQHSKYRETMCAYLNTNGGHIIYGILDNCIINGCSLTDNEKDSILLFVDGTFTIMKTTNGNNISKDKIKVEFEEIAKDIYIIIISCYKTKDDNNNYQFLGGDSWIRMNASNMKTSYGRLYSVNDICMVKTKIYKKYEDTINKLKREYATCEEDTILTISDIFEKKVIKEKNYVTTKSNIEYYFFGFIMIISIFTNIHLFSLLKNLCV